jgi:hypothetical protein
MDNQYDLAMLFLRYQEYYESPKWRGKIFTILDYMEWYSKDQCEWKHPKKKDETVQMFSYAVDWSGFNIPRRVFDELFPKIPDWNRYDAFMKTLYDMMVGQEGKHSFYLIGTFAGGARGPVDGDEDILSHEIAHALYYTNPRYKEAVLKELRRLAELKPGYLTKLENTIAKMGYNAYVLTDEAHAYLATGPGQEMKEWWDEEAAIPFQRLLKEAREECEK